MPQGTTPRIQSRLTLSGSPAELPSLPSAPASAHAASASASEPPAKKAKKIYLPRKKSTTPCAWPL